jgi:lipoprotein-anchoring transpeptidase ErfK/SrfK
MRLRESSVVAAILAALAGGAAAQSLPPAPYGYPQDGYRQDGYRGGQDGSIVAAPDNDYQRPLPPRSAPYVDRQPLPEAAIGREDGRYPAGPRYYDRLPQRPTAVPEPYPEPQIVRRPPGYGPMPPYDDPAPTAGIPTTRPESGDPALRPPAPIGPYAPPAAAIQPGVAAHPVPQRPTNLAALPPEDQPEEGAPKELPPQFRRQVVDYQTKEPAGTIVIDTPSTFLYYVNGDGTAVRYGIGVGREGFTWAGVERISRKAEWPDWHPPAEMIERQPYLPRFMAGGPGNPMGARALYLGKTVYRVHGTNQPSTIGQFVSSGCIRMLNEDVEDLYERAKIGAKVVVLSGGRGPSASNAGATR